MIIIGITGTLGAGKGTIVEYLVEKKGFKHHSVRSFIAKEIEKRNMSVNRDSLTMVANELRAAHSPSYIVDRLYEEALQDGKNAVIESIRTPGEVISLRKKGSFILIAIDADIRLRYERILLRGSETDHISFEEFQSNEQRELSNSDPNMQNLRKCFEMSDIQLSNNETIEVLYQKVEDGLKDLF
ncbi:MAG: AAA family ATPase [Bacteroidales bacterium]|jgi:dephospho-CoA kinase|nr:AAA family ATPase [Bacteroidales bacterium]